MPTNMRVLVGLRVLVGVGAIVAGAIMYPSAENVARVSRLGLTPLLLIGARAASENKAVPMALLFTGAALVLHTGADLFFAHLSRAGAPNATSSETSAGAEGSTSGFRGVASALVATLAAVLGLISAFTSDITTPIRVGVVTLGVAIFTGLVLISYLVFGQELTNLGQLSFISWLLNLVFVLTAFGLFCVAFAVVYR